MTAGGIDGHVADLSGVARDAGHGLAFDDEATTDTDLARQRELVEAFLEASRNGDFDALVEVLAPDVVFRVRGDSVPSATVHGREQAARRALARGSRLAHLGRPAIVNGGAGILVGPLDDPIAVVAMTIADGLIATVDVIVRPRLAG